MKSKKHKVYMTLVTGIAFLSFGSWSHAESKKTENRSSLIEMQEKMARLHEDAANCLKSDKTTEACKAEMMKQCPMGKSGCQMMGKMMSGGMQMGSGMMMDHGKEMNDSQKQ